MRFDKVLLDVEVQRDFFSPGGSCFAPPAATAARNVKRLFAWARSRHVPVISAVLRLRADRKGPLSGKPHCVEDTIGEKRLSGTTLPRCIDLGMRGTTDLPVEIFQHYQQVVFEQRYTDLFAHPRAERLLTELEVGTYVICGAGSAHGIVEAVVGLRQRNARIILAADAILDLGDAGAEMAWLRMLAKGAAPFSTKEIVAMPVAKPQEAPAARAQGVGALSRFVMPSKVVI